MFEGNSAAYFLPFTNKVRILTVAWNARTLWIRGGRPGNDVWLCYQWNGKLYAAVAGPGINCWWYYQTVVKGKVMTYLVPTPRARLLLNTMITANRYALIRLWFHPAWRVCNPGWFFQRSSVEGWRRDVGQDSSGCDLKLDATCHCRNLAMKKHFGFVQWPIVYREPYR